MLFAPIENGEYVEPGVALEDVNEKWRVNEEESVCVFPFCEKPMHEF